ncbi:ribose-5-phosphate isomerase RpiA [Virgibacillus sp. SK37]|uniref:ribose-5-phosphate isomerase RpiA n=1 Tax=Virgibacillus sp. SK37 TaxID=403957 RepID=UPI00119EFF71|nr:ribose-5-phosphate isomerase RpiA [Virgibacillus sp. SK37]
MIDKEILDKRLAAEASLEYVEDGMVIGFGSGSTVNWMLKKLGELVKDGLSIQGIPTSQRTERLARELGIPLTDFSEVTKVDIAIDGADEVDGNLNLLKGGGGSLVREKIVDSASDKLIIIVNDKKIVSTLGDFPLPVEVVPFGWEVTARKLEALGCAPTLRKGKNQIFISDNGNYILDCKFEKISNPKELHESLKETVGVVETGLFISMADQVIVSVNSDIKILTNEKGFGGS